MRKNAFQVTIGNTATNICLQITSDSPRSILTLLFFLNNKSKLYTVKNPALKHDFLKSLSWLEMEL